MYNYK